MTDNIKEQLLKKLIDRTAVVAVVGLGYVGLPLVVVFGNAGYKVIGIDTDQRKVDQLNKGISYIQDVPTADVKRLVDAGLLTATTDFSALARRSGSQHLCADAIKENRRPRPFFYCECH